MAQAMGVLDWFACQSGNHRWMFVDETDHCYRTCVRCGRTEHTEQGAPGENSWRSCSPAEAAFLRENALENGDHWDDYYTRDGWNPDWDDRLARESHDYWEFRASLRSPTDESAGVHTIGDDAVQTQEPLGK